MAPLRSQSSQKDQCFTHLQWYCGAEFKDEVRPIILFQKII